MMGIGAYSNELIRQGFSNAEVLARVRQRFPGCRTTPGCIAWYRNKLTQVQRPARPGTPEPRRAWPEWGLPSEHELLQLARLTTPYVRFLHPEIIRAVVADNELKAPFWSSELRARNIDPSVYLWPGSSCAFPGVRRHAGGSEISGFRKSTAEKVPKDALTLDDNSYPKQIWSLLLRGDKFANTGPTGYSLAHIADHKAYKDRGVEEFDGIGATPVWRTLPGLFTCVSNTVFIADGLIRPTDFAFPLRNLIQRKAAALYSGICNLLPPEFRVRPVAAQEWSVDQFAWEEIVAPANPVGEFLAYRDREIDKLLAARPAN